MSCKLKATTCCSSATVTVRLSVCFVGVQVHPREAQRGNLLSFSFSQENAASQAGWQRANTHYESKHASATQTHTSQTKLLPFLHSARRISRLRCFQIPKVLTTHQALNSPARVHVLIIVLAFRCFPKWKQLIMIMILLYCCNHTVLVLVAVLEIWQTCQSEMGTISRGCVGV